MSPPSSLSSRRPSPHCVAVMLQADFHHFGMFLSYVYAPVVGDGWASGGESVDVTVTFPELATATRPAEYCLCYLTKKYSLMAISNRFKVRPTTTAVAILLIIRLPCGACHLPHRYCRLTSAVSGDGDSSQFGRWLVHLLACDGLLANWHGLNG